MKKNILLWALYDFANSIIMIVFLFYFSQWLVIDSGKPDWWYNATLIVSSLLFIVTAPIAGQRLDATGNKLSGVRVTSVLALIFYLSTALVVLLSPSMALLATVLFTIAMYIYLMSFIYYTPMINDLTTNTNRGLVSGLGMAANYVGQVFGLFVTLPFATGTIELFGTPGRAQTLVPAIIFCAISALPLLIAYKESDNNKVVSKICIYDEYAKVFHTVRTVFSIKNLSFLLIGYFFFSDALLTFANNFPIFLEKVFGAVDSIKTYLTAGILTISGVGSLIFGKLADKKGTMFTLILLLAFWVIFFPALAFSPSLKAAAVLCLIGGLFFGPVWGVSRAMVSEFSPAGMEARSFSFYILAERFATFIGPITWSITLSVTANYSYALASMGILVLLGLLFVTKIAKSNLRA